MFPLSRFLSKTEEVRDEDKFVSTCSSPEHRAQGEPRVGSLRGDAFHLGRSPFRGEGKPECAG